MRTLRQIVLLAMVCDLGCNGSVGTAHADAPVEASAAEPESDEGIELVDTLTTRRGELSFDRIVGGMESEDGKWPFVVALAVSRKPGSNRPRHLTQFCGGTLIGPRWVVTAAHCNPQKDMVIIAGRSDLSHRGGAVIPIEEVFIHREYDPESKANDIAVIKLERPYGGVALTKRLRLPAPGVTTPAGSPVTTMGWGRTSLAAPKPTSALREASLIMVENSSCGTALAAEKRVVTDSMLCATAPGKDACGGDSGGPLVSVDDKGESTLVGIVSWGVGCASGYPGVYTRVDRYLPFIAGVTGRT